MTKLTAFKYPRVYFILQIEFVDYPVIWYRILYAVKIASCSPIKPVSRVRRPAKREAGFVNYLLYLSGHCPSWQQMSWRSGKFTGLWHDFAHTRFASLPSSEDFLELLLLKQFRIARRNRITIGCSWALPQYNMTLCICRSSVQRTAPKAPGHAKTGSNIRLTSLANINARGAMSIAMGEVSSDDRANDIRRYMKDHGIRQECQECQYL